MSPLLNHADRARIRVLLISLETILIMDSYLECMYAPNRILTLLYDNLTIITQHDDRQFRGCSRYIIVNRLVLALDLCVVIHSNTVVVLQKQTMVWCSKRKCVHFVKLIVIATFS